ncbi:hypothetical protein NPIL_405691, partial [Nephila pilipes]
GVAGSWQKTLFMILSDEVKGYCDQLPASLELNDLLVSPTVVIYLAQAGMRR